MIRKLHNSLMALVASCGLLAVGLMAAAPNTPALHAPEGAALAYLQAEMAGGDANAPREAAPSDASAALAERERSPRRSLRRGRPSVSMPFFSFAPRS
jgi:hypothetical protein